MTTQPSRDPTHTVGLTIPDELIETIAIRVSELLRQQIEEISPQGSPWLNLDGACSYLGLSRDALYKLTAARAIPFRKKVGGQGLRFHRDELNDWMGTHYPRLDRLP